MARGMAVEIVLTDSEREELGVRRRATPVVGSCPRAAARAEIVLLAADGLNTSASTAELSQSTQKLNRNFGIGTLG